MARFRRVEQSRPQRISVPPNQMHSFHSIHCPGTLAFHSTPLLQPQSQTIYGWTPLRRNFYDLLTARRAHENDKSARRNRALRKIMPSILLKFELAKQPSSSHAVPPCCTPPKHNLLKYIMLVGMKCFRIFRGSQPFSPPCGMVANELVAQILSRRLARIPSLFFTRRIPHIARTIFIKRFKLECHRYFCWIIWRGMAERWDRTCHRFRSLRTCFYIRPCRAPAILLSVLSIQLSCAPSSSDCFCLFLMRLTCAFVRNRRERA